MVPEDPSDVPAQVIKVSIRHARYGEKFWVAAGAAPLQHCQHWSWISPLELSKIIFDKTLEI